METDTIFPPELFRAILIKCKFNYGMVCVTKCHFAVGHSRAGKGRRTWKVTSRSRSLSLPQTMGTGPKFNIPIRPFAQWPTYGTHFNNIFCIFRGCGQWFSGWSRRLTKPRSWLWFEAHRPNHLLDISAWISASPLANPSTPPSILNLVVTLESLPSPLDTPPYISLMTYLPCNFIITFFICVYYSH